MSTPACFRYLHASWIPPYATRFRCCPPHPGAIGPHRFNRHLSVLDAIGDAWSIAHSPVCPVANRPEKGGAAEAETEWLIPIPIDVVPGRRGPVGVAGNLQATEVRQS